MKKVDEKTKSKLEQLSLTLGGFDDIDKKADDEVIKKSSYVSPFKTSEVIILLFLTCAVSLLMGGLVIYRINLKSGKSIDKELQNFIENYEYITDNYYDDIDKSKLIESAVAGMLTTLDKNSSYVGGDDSSFNVYLEGNYKGIGIQVYNNDEGKIVIYKVMENTPAEKSGLEAGDVILKISDKDVEGMNTSDVSELIKKQKNKFNITYLRNSEKHVAIIENSNIDLTSVTSKVIERDNKKIGYIRMDIFASNSYNQFDSELLKLEKKNISSLIIDLRDNSGGHLSVAEDIISLFLDSTHPIYQIKSKEKQSKYYSNGKSDKDYKIIILVNGGSASASEVLTSALSEQLGAVIVGEKTYGKGTVQELQTLSSGGKYKITTKMWLTSKGKQVDKKGINPDIEVKLSDSYKNNPKDENDNQLQKAIDEAIK